MWAVGSLVKGRSKRDQMQSLWQISSCGSNELPELRYATGE